MIGHCNPAIFIAFSNLTQRVDTQQNLTENFLYDQLNRVVQVDTDTGTVTTVTMAYTSRGKIASKSDVGTYTYAQNHSGCTSGFAGPHALTEVAGTKNATYCYDLNGNMTSGDGRVVTYSAFDKPTWITKGSSSVFFSYGPDRARYKRVDQTTAGTTTTLYVGGKAFEKIIKPTETLEKHYIGDFAVITVNTATTITTTDYLHRDHLGSVDTITDAASIVLQRMSFDAWGKRRETNWQPMSEAARLTFDTSLTTRGFTGHEMVDSVGLVHMNGRVYDAELGRFLSADPFVQDTTNLQSWNRYSYVLNNPLSYTDPTGFFFNKIFKAIGNVFKSVFKAIGRIFKAVLNSPIGRAIIQIIACAPGPHAIATCAAASAGMALAAGGSVIDALKSAALSFVQMGAWEHIAKPLIQRITVAAELGQAGFAAVKGAVQGVIGGALSLAQGGNFTQGFLSSAIAGAVGAYSSAISGGNLALDTAIVAAAGCAAAAASGGKCGNGALTAAFANMYNKMGGQTQAWEQGGGIGGIGIATGGGLSGAALWKWLTGFFSATTTGGEQSDQYLYRGVHAEHPALGSAKNGVVVPGNVNGKTTAEEHNLGINLGDSPYTSWTHMREIASFNAGKYGSGGVILRVPIGPPPAGATWRWEYSPDVFGEGERLMRGVRTGVEVWRRQ